MQIKPLDTGYKAERYIPNWNKRFLKIAAKKEYWKRFKVGDRTFTKAFSPFVDFLLLEIVKMTQTDYNLIKDDLKWK